MGSCSSNSVIEKNERIAACLFNANAATSTSALVWWTGGKRVVILIRGRLLPGLVTFFLTTGDDTFVVAFPLLQLTERENE